VNSACLFQGLARKGGAPDQGAEVYTVLKLSKKPHSH
jgi:hypothetical protein